MELVIHRAAQSSFEQLAQDKTVSVLLHGPRGVGLATLARELARRVLCTEDCANRSCANCVRVVTGSHDRLMEVLPDEKDKIGVEAIADLRRRLALQHLAGTMQVVMINQADTMTLAAQNALLKTLEEPPSGTLIVLTATAADRLLATMRSRLQTLYFPVPGESMVAQYLANRYDLTLTEANDLAHLGRGLPALAIRLHELPPTRQLEQAARGYLERLTARELYPRLQAAAELSKDGPVLNILLALLPQWAQAQLRHSHDPKAAEAVEHIQERIRANVSSRTALEAFAVEVPC